MGLKLKRLDWALLIFVAALIFFLFNYTDIPQKGIINTAVEGFSNLKKMQNHEELFSEKTGSKDQEAIKEKLTQEENISFCQSTFFPLLPGAKWTYRTVTNDKEDTLEIGIPSPENNNYFIDGRTFSLKNWTIRTLMRCQNGNRIEINDLNFLNLIEWKNIVTKPCEENKFYFSLPSDSELENKKNTVRREEGCLERVFINPENNEEKISHKEKIEAGWEIVGWEKVTVPAGEYETVKIKLGVRSTEESKAPLEEIIDFWVAKEIGIVKIENRKNPDSSLGQGSADSVSELISFQIPTEQKYKKRTSESR